MMGFILEQIIKILYIGIGAILGFVGGVAYITLGIAKVAELSPTFNIIFPILLLSGIIGFYLFSNRDKEIEKIKNEQTNT